MYSLHPFIFHSIVRDSVYFGIRPCFYLSNQGASSEFVKILTLVRPASVKSRIGVLYNDTKDPKVISSPGYKSPSGYKPFYLVTKILYSGYSTLPISARLMCKCILFVFHYKDQLFNRKLLVKRMGRVI